MSTLARGSYFLAHAPEAVRRIASIVAHGSAGAAPQEAVERAERALGEVAWHDDVDVASWVVRDPFRAAIAVATLADEPRSLAGARIAEVLPELAGLAVPSRATTHEHEPASPEGRPTPLLDRVIRSLVCADQLAESLDASSKSLVAAALLFSDVAKGGTAAQRETWRHRLGVDGTVHNEDSAVILEDVVRRVLGKALLSEDGRWAERARALVAASGLVGMRLRGEVGRDALAGFLDVVHEEADAGLALARVWSIVNRCETSSVRRELWTPELARAFASEEEAVLHTPSTRDFARSQLAERIARMRGGALMQRESLAEVEATLEQLRAARAVLESRLAHCRIWYAEAALGALTLEGTVRLLLHLSGAAQHASIDTTRAWHLDLLGIVPELREADGAPKRYPVRLLETLLEATKLDELRQGKLAGKADTDGRPLVSFPSTKGGEQALAVRFTTSDEASALLTLLSIYERKASAAFHATLKALCDLYGLRKDDFDRVHNEASYLATMNAARSDKSRMCDFVKPGTIVEIGPGGGVVLELLAERFPGSRVLGIDASEAVVAAHKERHAGKNPGYEIVHGDAFELGEIVGREAASTVVFCSVLHEIYSYVPWGEPPKRFSLGSVEAMVGEAFRALARGGRIVVRDGVAPTDEPRVLELVDPSWREALDLFAKSFEARTPSFEVLSPTRVRIGQRDLYEFLTTVTWGPDAFPYEIREQRAVMSRAEWSSFLLEACRKAEPERDVREVPVPADLASYLQPGYPAHLEGKVKIYDAAGERELPMPDVNGLIVIEKA